MSDDERRKFLLTGTRTANTQQTTDLSNVQPLKRSGTRPHRHMSGHLPNREEVSWVRDEAGRDRVRCGPGRAGSVPATWAPIEPTTWPS